MFLNHSRYIDYIGIAPALFHASTIEAAPMISVSIDNITICLRNDQSLGSGTCATNGIAASTGRQYQGIWASIIAASEVNPHSSDSGKVNVLPQEKGFPLVN